MFGPGLFSDIGKRSRDLLKNGYISHQKLIVSTKSDDTGVALSSTLLMKGELAAGHLDASYNFKNVMANAKLDTEFGNISTTLIMNILPSTKTIASLTFPHNLAGKVETQYVNNYASLSGALSLKDSSASMVELSGTMGASGRSVGFEVSIDLQRKFSDYRVGVGLSKEDWSTSMIMSDQGNVFTASYLQHLSKSSVGVLEMSHTFSTDTSVVTVGGSRAFDDALLKGKINSECVVGAVLALDLDSVVRRVVFSGEFDATKLNIAPTFGLSLLVEP